MGEMEKYQDTQLNNQYKLALKDVAVNWHNNDDLDAVMRRGDFMTAARYANYGQEKIAEASNKWKAAVAETAAQAAINQTAAKDGRVAARYCRPTVILWTRRNVSNTTRLSARGRKAMNK